MDRKEQISYFVSQIIINKPILIPSYMVSEVLKEKEKRDGKDYKYFYSSKGELIVFE